MDFNNQEIYFKYINNPGDMFRDCLKHKIPDPNTDEEGFWVWFHPNYQSSEDIASINRLFLKLEEEPDNCKIIKEIKKLKEKINFDCFENFYIQIREGNLIILSS